MLQFKKQLGKVFKIKDLRELEKILRIRLIRDRQARILKLNQKHFIQKNLIKLGITKEMANLTLLLIDSYKSLKPTGLYNKRGNRTEY